MKRIRTKDGNLYEVPVISIISDANTYKLIDNIFDSFFEAVERVYGVGWGRKGWQWIYVDEWNTCIDVPNNPFRDVHPVGKEYRQQYDPTIAAQIASIAFKSAFPLPYLLIYEPTTQLAEHDVPRDEQWRLMAYIIRQLHHKRTWIDAVFVDAVNHDHDRPQDSYDASAIPPILENLPVTIFNSPEHLAELLTKNEIFLGVKEFTILPKN